jgi:hypothetical protein
MTRRVAALFALLAFAVAWLIGVARGESPLTRLENAGLALLAAFVAGLAIGVALEKIVLARLSESVRELPKEGTGRDGEAAFEAAPAATRAEDASPAASTASRATARAADGAAAQAEAVR